MKKDLLLAASAWFPKPVRHYTFEPNTVNGNVLTDLSGVQNGAIVGSPIFAAGQRGNCVKFDGNSANYIDIGNTDFVQQTGVFSITFWAKTQYTDSGKLMVICGNAVSNARYGFFIGFDDRPVAPRNRTLAMGLFDSGGTAGSIYDFLINNILPTDGLYHHYAITYDNNTAYAYIDGAQVGSIKGKRALSNNGTTVNALIACANNNGTATFPYDGEIDEFRIIPKTLTSQQVKRLYQTGK